MNRDLEAALRATDGLPLSEGRKKQRELKVRAKARRLDAERQEREAARTSRDAAQIAMRFDDFSPKTKVRMIFQGTEIQRSRNFPLLAQGLMSLLAQKFSL